MRLGWAILLSALLATPGAGSADTLGRDVTFGLGAEDVGRFAHKAPGQWTGRVFRLSMGGIGGEVGALLTFPLRRPRAAGVFLLGAAALVSVDRQTTGWWQDRVEPAFDGVRLPPLFGDSGAIPVESQYVLAGIGLTYAGGVLLGDERAQTAALLSAKAVGYSYLVSQVVLKPVFGRLRPVDGLSSYAGPDPYPLTTDPWRFGHARGIPFAGGVEATSMPSFHFTQYFAIARVYSGVYDNYLVPYAVAGLISVANIRGHNHWVSDMVAGAVIGTGIGNLVLNGYRDRRAGDLRLAPLVTLNGPGIGWRIEF